MKSLVLVTLAVTVEHADDVDPESVLDEAEFMVVDALSAELKLEVRDYENQGELNPDGTLKEERRDEKRGLYPLCLLSPLEHESTN